MEPNLLPESISTSFSIITSAKNANTAKVMGPPVAFSEITIKEFLDFLKTAYQVHESLEGVLRASGMNEAIDWLKLKELQLGKGKESGCQTDAKNFGLAPLSREKEDRSSRIDRHFKDPISVKKKSTSDLLQSKLSEVMSEGLLDSVAPYLVPNNSQSSNRKNSLPTSHSSSKNVSDKSNSNINSSSSNEKPFLKGDRTKSGTDIFVKRNPTPVVTKTTSEVEIHVCDEIKNIKRDFTCNQKLLVEKMGYFAEVTEGQKLEEMDISVHCDVGIFDWLMKWVKKETTPEEDWPILEVQCVIPVLVSAAFLQMEPLLEECLLFCHEHLNDILRTNTNFSCLNDSILTRLAAMYTNIELEQIKDRKDKIQSKLYTKMIMSLVEPEPESVRGHWCSLARVYKCEKCSQIISPMIGIKIPCIPSCMRLQYDGSILSHHVRDKSWNINDYIIKLFKQLKSWRRVYWRLWGDAHFLFCNVCKKFFPVHQLGWCRYHPDAPQFFTLDAQKAPLPVGRYPCCGERAYRFQLLTSFIGCNFREHSVLTKDVRDVAVLTMAENYRDLIEVEPPQLMFPERLTRLVARDANTSDKFVCRESFWWDGLEIIPPRPKLGLLSLFTSQNGQNPQIPAPTPSPTFDDNSDDDSGSTTDSSSGSSTSTSVEESNPKPVVNATKAPTKKKRGKTKLNSRLWQINMSARSNQDKQRAHEEKSLKQMSNLLHKKIVPYEVQKCGKTTTKNLSPLGGLWVRLEAEWKEMYVPPQQPKNKCIVIGKTKRNMK